MDLQNLHPVRLGGHPDLDLAVEPPGSSERRIDRIRPVRCPDHDHLPAVRDPVHHRQKLRDHTPLDLAVDILPLGCDRIQFIDEDDRRSVVFRIFKDLAKFLLRLAIILRDDLRACDRDEMRPALACHSLGDQRLSGPGRPVHKDTFRRLYTQRLKQLGVADRQFDHLTHASQFAFQPADILIGYRLRPVKNIIIVKDELGIFRQDAGILRLKCRDLELQGRMAGMERLYRHDIIQCDREVDEGYKIFILFVRERVRKLCWRHQRDRGRGDLLNDFLHSDPVSRTDACIRPRIFIDSDLILIPVAFK